MQVDLAKLKQRILSELDRLEQKKSRLREELRAVGEVERLAKEFEGSGEGASAAKESQPETVQNVVQNVEEVTQEPQFVHRWA